MAHVEARDQFCAGVEDVIMGTKRRKKEIFSRWDAADFLKSEEEMAAYLQACLDEAPDDPTLLSAALGDIARARGMAEPAREAGRTRDGL